MTKRISFYTLISCSMALSPVMVVLQPSSHCSMSLITSVLDRAMYSIYRVAQKK